MSKKKNTLQDLDDFLKQQAATLVTPDSLTSNAEAVPKDNSVVTVRHEENTKPISEDHTPIPSSGDPDFRKKFYDFIIQSLEAQKDSLPEDKMLINTALYLKSGSDWKNVIRDYWRGISKR